MIKQFTALLLCLCMIPVGSNCKPRRGSSLKEGKDVEKSMVDIGYIIENRTKARNNPALFFMMDTAIDHVDEILKIVREAKDYRTKYIGVGAVADMLAVAPIWLKQTEKSKPKRTPKTDRISVNVLLNEALAEFKNPNPKTLQCKVKGKEPFEYKSQFCSDFSMCADAFTYLTSFSRVNWSDKGIMGRVNQIMNSLERGLFFRFLL